MASIKVCMVVMMVVLVSSLSSTEAQATAACASKLIPCQEYLNTTTTPPANCCNPIVETVKNDLTCLCNLYNDPNFLASLNINVTQAVELSRRCGVTTNLNDCNKAAASPTGAPPVVPGSDGGRIAVTGFSTLFLLWVSSMLY